MVRGLTVAYGDVPALDAVDLLVGAGEFVAVIGPNGAGKSTLLRAVLGLVSPSAGEVAFSGELGPRPRRALAYVPQQGALDWGFPVTVEDVVTMGRTDRVGWLRRPGPPDRRAVAVAIEATGLSDLARRLVGALSGGQRQRVLLARMLARESRLLLLDEPLTGVDPATQAGLLGLLERERAAGRAIVMVTHDLESAAERCTGLVLLNRAVVAAGPPETVYTPENVAATFATSRLSHTHARA